MVELPTLYKFDSAGKVRIWKVQVNLEDDTYITTAGVEGTKNPIIKVKRVKPNKNQSMEDALNFKAKSEWNKKKQSGAMKPKEELNEGILFPISPTLATKYTEDIWKKNKGASCYVQYKYDGLLAIATVRDGIVMLHSRGREQWNFCNHIKEAVVTMMNKLPHYLNKNEFHLVGELYIHGTELEHINSIVQGKDGIMHERNSEVKYIIYDLADDPTMKMVYDDRLKLLQALFHNNKYDCIQLAPIIGNVDNHEDAKMLLDKAEKEGYEGIIIRNPDMIYHRKNRYKNPLLMKYKNFFDEEVTITGASCGKNSHEGCILFIVKLDDEKLPEFTVTPRGDLQTRRDLYDEYLEDPKQFIGKKYTIRYPEKNSYGIPKFAIGVSLRNEINMDQE